MQSHKKYRFENNPKEKEFHDKFIEMLDHGMGSRNLSAMIFGWSDDTQHSPKEYLTEREEEICLNLIQWLGSPVGQGFLRDCGFEEKK